MAVRMSMTPPDALPKRLDADPRNTSMDETADRSTLVSWPCPSGSVWGTPSRRTLTPRTPNAERAPKPRMETRWSRDGLYRFATSTPGISTRLSSRPSVGRPRRRSSAVTTDTAKGTVPRDVGLRVTDTWMGARTTAESWAVESGGVR